MVPYKKLLFPIPFLIDVIDWSSQKYFDELSHCLVKSQVDNHVLVLTVIYYFVLFHGLQIFPFKYSTSEFQNFVGRNSTSNVKFVVLNLESFYQIKNYLKKEISYINIIRIFLII